jgi:hypothetical protein
MNRQKFITQFVALCALTAGFATQALAGGPVQCSDPVICGPDHMGPYTQLPGSDTTGSVTVPENVIQYPIAVAKFDPAMAAAAEGVTVDRIKLQRVNVTLTLQIEDFNLNIQNTDTTSPCNYSLNYQIDALINANATLGTGAISAIVDLSLPPTFLEAYDGTLGGPDSLQRTLADYPANDIFQEECAALEGDLSAWIGPGSAMWTLDVSGTNVPSGCPQSLQGVSSHLRADVSVDYYYCVERDCTNVCFFCFGDAGDCPCGGNSLSGGCLNSTGVGGELSATGSGDYNLDNLVFTASNLLLRATCLGIDDIEAGGGLSIRDQAAFEVSNVGLREVLVFADKHDNLYPKVFGPVLPEAVSNDLRLADVASWSTLLGVRPDKNVDPWLHKLFASQKLIEIGSWSSYCLPTPVGNFASS